MIEIDGSHGEGGGQIVRTAVALSCLTEKPLRIFNIRKKREKPGLRPQHLNAVRGIADMCSADVSGLAIGSTGITFSPNGFRHRNTRIDIGTAGSITLVLQAALIAGLRADKKIGLEITGGTEVRNAPTVDYAQNVIMRFLESIGYSTGMEIVQRGYFPKGGGLVRAEINPCKGIGPFSLLEQEKVGGINGVCIVTGLPEDIAQREKQGAQKELIDYACSISKLYEKKWVSEGTSVTLWAENNFLGSDALGERGKRAEAVGAEAAQKLLAEINSGACIDRHLADNLIPYMAYCNKPCSFKTSEITEHLRTNVWVCGKFLDKKFDISGPRVRTF